MEKDKIINWLENSFADLSEIEIQECYADYSDLISWWISVLKDELLTESEDGSTVEK